MVKVKIITGDYQIQDCEERENKINVMLRAIRTKYRNPRIMQIQTKILDGKNLWEFMITYDDGIDVSHD